MFDVEITVSIRTDWWMDKALKANNMAGNLQKIYEMVVPKMHSWILKWIILQASWAAACTLIFKSLKYGGISNIYFQHYSSSMF